MSYKNLGGGGALTVNGNGGADTLIVDGTAGVDAFVVDPVTGTVHVNGRTPIQQIGVTNLVLNGLGGDNHYTIGALQPFASITVNGSGNSDPDVLDLNGDGSSPVTVNLGGPTQTVSGGGLGTVVVTGVGILNVSNLGGDINVLGTSGPDSFSVSPTGANTATIQDGALAPILNTTNTGALTIAEGTAGDGDTVAVYGTERQRSDQRRARRDDDRAGRRFQTSQHQHGGRGSLGGRRRPGNRYVQRQRQRRVGPDRPGQPNARGRRAERHQYAVWNDDRYAGRQFRRGHDRQPRRHD